jgi:hypothetical protein
MAGRRRPAPLTLSRLRYPNPRVIFMVLPRVPVDTTPPEPPAHLYQQLQAAMAAEPAPAIARAQGHDTWLLYAALSVAPLLLFLNTHLKLSAADARLAVAALWPSAFGALLIAVLVTHLVRAQGQGLGLPIGALTWLALSVVPLSLLPLVHRGMQLAKAAATPGLAYAYAYAYHREPHCLEVATLVLGSSLFIVSRGFKHTVPVAAGWRSAAIGAAAGAWTILAMLVYCPDVDVVHLLVKHMAPACLAPLAAFWVLRRYVQL